MKIDENFISIDEVSWHTFYCKDRLMFSIVLFFSRITSFHKKSGYCFDTELVKVRMYFQPVLAF